MARINAVRESLDKVLRDDSKPWSRYLIFAEQKTGLDRTYIFVATVVFLGIYLVVGIGQQLVSNILGFLYPAYSSMKAIESKQTNDDTKWLTYWVVFALLSIIEYFADFIVGWFPIYWLFKCLLYIWLMIPTEYNGSLIIYRRIIRPKFMTYHTNVDAFLNDARRTLSMNKVAANLLDSKTD